MSSYIPIASRTITNTSTQLVVFSSIPATFRDLVLTVGGGAQTGTDLVIRFNSDFSSNNNFVQMSGDGSTAASRTVSNDMTMRLTRYAYLTTVVGSYIVNIMDYSATDKHKALLARSNGQFGTDATAGRWANTAAINTIFINPENDNWTQGTVISLYGVAA
jgi:hypothetical protein